MSGGNGLFTTEQYVALKERCNSYAAENIQQNIALESLRGQVGRLNADLARVSAELSAERQNVAILSKDNANRYDAANRAAQEYREKLIANGINPDK